MSAARERWREWSRAERVRVAREVAGKTLSQRMEESVAWYLVTLSETARGAVDSREFLRRCRQGDPPPDLPARWRVLHGSTGRDR